MAAPAKGCGRGRDPRDPWPPPSTLVEVTEFTALGHAPAPAHRTPVLSRGAPRGPAERRGTGPGAAARDRGAGRGPPEGHPRPPQRRPQRRTMRGRPRHSPLTWPCRLPAGAPTARGIVGSRLRDARHGKGNWPGPGHGSMASAPTRRAAARDCGMSPCSLLSPRAGFRRCAAPPPRQPRQEGARTR